MYKKSWFYGLKITKVVYQTC